MFILSRQLNRKHNLHMLIHSDQFSIHVLARMFSKKHNTTTTRNKSECIGEEWKGTKIPVDYPPHRFQNCLKHSLFSFFLDVETSLKSVSHASNWDAISSICMLRFLFIYSKKEKPFLFHDTQLNSSSFYFFCVNRFKKIYRLMSIGLPDT